MRVTAKVTSIRDAIQREEKILAKAITGGMSDATQELKDGWRAQVRFARLGDRLANTIRATTYPERKDSLHPTAYAWTKAPAILSFYANGGDIVPINGHKYLAIPTKAVPRGRRRRRQTVAEVEAQLGKLIVLKGKGGHNLGFYDPARTKAGNRRRGTGRQRNLILLFTFVPIVKGRKRFDVPTLARQVAARVPDLIKARLG